MKKHNSRLTQYHLVFIYCRPLLRRRWIKYAIFSPRLSDPSAKAWLPSTDPPSLKWSPMRPHQRSCAHSLACALLVMPSVSLPMGIIPLLFQYSERFSVTLGSLSKLRNRIFFSGLFTCIHLRSTSHIEIISSCSCRTAYLLHALAFRVFSLK